MVNSDSKNGISSFSIKLLVFSVVSVAHISVSLVVFEYLQSAKSDEKISSSTLQNRKCTSDQHEKMLHHTEVSFPTYQIEGKKMLETVNIKCLGKILSSRNSYSAGGNINC